MPFARRNVGISLSPREPVTVELGIVYVQGGLGSARAFGHGSQRRPILLVEHHPTTIIILSARQMGHDFRKSIPKPWEPASPPRSVTR